MASYKIIGGDQKQYGPVSAEDIRQWIAEGRLSGQSLVQTEASGPWQPLASLPEFAGALGTQVGAAPATGATHPTADAAGWSAEILARQPQVQIGRCLSGSCRLLLSNFGLLFGAALLVGGLNLLCRFIPLVGGVASLLLHGVLYGGLYLIFLKKIRGSPASVADAFSGFGAPFVQLMLAGFVSSLLSGIGVCCLILPGIYLLVAWTFSVPLVADRSLEFWSAMELSRKVVTRVWFEMFGLIVVAFLPSILSTLFAQIKISSAIFPLMQDIMSSGQPDLKRVMELATQIARTSFPLIMLTKGIFLLNLPFAVGALMYAYEDLFGTRTAPAP